MKAVFDHRYVKKIDGPNVKKGKNKLDLAEQLRQDIREFKKSAEPIGWSRSGAHHRSLH